VPVSGTASALLFIGVRLIGTGTGFIQLLMCNIFQQGGLIAGPMAGAWLRSAVGFETTMLIGAVVVFGYLCGAVGWTVRSMEPDEVD